MVVQQVNMSCSDCSPDGCCSYLEIKEERGEENGIYQRRLESSPWVYQQIGIIGDAKCIFFLGVWSVDWCAWMEVYQVSPGPYPPGWGTAGLPGGWGDQGV